MHPGQGGRSGSLRDFPFSNYEFFFSSTVCEPKVLNLPHAFSYDQIPAFEGNLATTKRIAKNLGNLVAYRIFQPEESYFVQTGTVVRLGLCFFMTYADRSRIRPGLGLIRSQSHHNFVINCDTRTRQDQMVTAAPSYFDSNLILDVNTGHSLGRISLSPNTLSSPIGAWSSSGPSFINIDRKSVV